MTQPAFGARLHAAVAARGPLVVGIDPHLPLLRDWGLPEDVSGLERFALTAVEAVADRVAVVKPQSAFFERFGSRGIAVLERVLAAIRAAGALSLLDVKRGDIGSTMVGYAGAYLDPASPLAADAITASPYLGFGSLRPLLDAAYANGRGVFVLALTSNPEGRGRAAGGRGRRADRRADDPGRGARRPTRPRAARSDRSGWSSAPPSASTATGWTTCAGRCSRPGLGAQGAGPADLPAVFGAALPLVLPAASREVLGAGPDPVRLRATTDRIAAEVMAIRTSTMAVSGR